MPQTDAALSVPAQTIPLPPPEPDTDTEMIRQLAAIRRLLGTLLVALLGIGMYFTKEILLPFVIGTLLALTLSPLVRNLQRFGIAPPVTAILLIVGLSGVLGGTAFVMSGPVSTWVSEVPRMEVELKRKLEMLAASMKVVKQVSDQVDEMTAQSSDPTVQKVTIQSPGLLVSAVTNVSSLVTTLAVTLLLALFLLSSGDLFYVKLIDAFPRFGDKKRALRIVYGIERGISRYLLSVTLINLGLGVAVGLAMWAVGMPQPVIWGVGAFLLNYLPYLGALVGIGLSAAVAVVTFDSLSHAALVPILYGAATTLEGQFITPFLLGRRMQLNTVAVFVTVVFWGWLWGLAGALMAVPFLVCLKVLCDNIESLHTLGSFLNEADPVAGRTGE